MLKHKRNNKRILRKENKIQERAFGHKKINRLTKFKNSIDMLNCNVGGNLPGCRTRWKMGLKNDKIRDSFQEATNPTNRSTERKNRENREEKIIRDIIKKCFRTAQYKFPDLKRLQNPNIIMR